MNTLSKTNVLPAGRVWFDDFFTRELDKFFSKDVSANKAALPAANVWEDEKSLCLEYALPGVNKDEITVKFENGLLTVSTEKKQAQEEKQKDFHRQEFSYVSYSRSFRVNEKKYKTDAAEATFENGILKLTLPKVTEEKKESSRVIAIH